MYTEEREITYDRDRLMAKFQGPGGFTQYFMPETTAQAIGQALKIPFRIER